MHVAGQGTEERRRRSRKWMDILCAKDLRLFRA